MEDGLSLQLEQIAVPSEPSLDQSSARLDSSAPRIRFRSPLLRQNGSILAQDSLHVTPSVLFLRQLQTPGQDSQNKILIQDSSRQDQEDLRTFKLGRLQREVAYLEKALAGDRREPNWSQKILQKKLEILEEESKKQILRLNRCLEEERQKNQRQQRYREQEELDRQFKYSFAAESNTSRTQYKGLREALVSAQRRISELENRCQLQQKALRGHPQLVRQLESLQGRLLQNGSRLGEVRKCMARREEQLRARIEQLQQEAGQRRSVGSAFGRSRLTKDSISTVAPSPECVKRR